MSTTTEANHGAGGVVPRVHVAGYEDVLIGDVTHLARRFVDRTEWASRPDVFDLMAVPQFVYFIGTPRSFVKIGYSTFVPGRLDALRKANPEPLEVLGVMRGPVVLERTLHQRFAALWIHGEWFRREGELADLLSRAA